MPKRVVLILLLFLLAGWAETKAQSNCYPDSDCGAWDTTQYFVVYPAFPTCTLTVDVRVRECDGVTQIQVLLVQFYNPLNPTGCQSFVNWLWTGGSWPTGGHPDPDKWKTVMEFIYNDVIFQRVEGAFQDPAIANYYNCDDGRIGPINNYSYYIGSCYAVCFAIYQVTLPAGPGGPMTITFPIFNVASCTNICCQKTITYCWDAVNQEIVRNVVTTPAPNAPDCDLVPDPPCFLPTLPFGTKLWEDQTPCLEACEE